MPILAQFQLGLELTNIVHPLTQALWTTASLALSNDIENGASNMITEMKLASLLGNLRIGMHRPKAAASGSCDMSPALD